jgi:hypothetical protein
MTFEERIPLNKYYTEMDWPSVPDDICEEIITYVNTAPNIREARRNGDNDGFTMHDIPDSLREWVKTNLPFITDDYRIRIQKSRAYCPPHRDALRSSSFNFVVSDDDATTLWHDVNNDMSIIESVVYKKRVWYHHQSQIHHSVKNTSAFNRISVTIFKFKLQEFPEFADFTGNRFDPNEVESYLSNKRRNIE